MINEVDEALRALVRSEVVSGADVDVAFDAPTREWAATRSNPTIDLYLYDIREDLERRQTGVVERRNDQRIVEERHELPRFYELAYLVTAWTQRPEDEHRLLSAVLGSCVVHDVVPAEHMPPLLAGLGVPLRLAIACPPPVNRQVLDVWCALGGTPKASLDLVVTLPIRPSSLHDIAQVVMEPLRLHTYGKKTVAVDDGVRQLREAAAAGG